MSGQSGRAADGGPAAGDLAAQPAAAVERVGRVLAELGADLDDAVKVNTYFAGDGTRATWEPVARERARRFSAPGPVVTDLPTPRLPARRGRPHRRLGHARRRRRPSGPRW